MGGTLAGAATRIAAGLGLVGCAAIVAFTIGGGGVFGGLGSLLGRDGQSLEVAQAEAPAADIVAAPTAAQRAAVERRSTLVRRRAARGPATVRRHEAQHPQAQPHANAPAPQPAPQPPPVIPPAPPPPGGGGVVSQVSNAVKNVADQAPPPLQPVTKPVEDAVDTLVGACTSLPVCP